MADPNTKEKMRVDLESVPETMLIPLYLRARESQRPDAIIRDPRAEEIVSAIDYDFTPCDTGWRLQLDVAIRTELVDEQVRKFLDRHDKAIVVNLGAGLDGRFERLDNGRVRWFELDVPESIAVRRRFFEESERDRFIAKSMFDYSWIDDLGRADDEPVLIYAEGLVHYFEESQIKELFGQIADRLPGAELVFHSINPLLVNRHGLVHGVNKTTAEFKWGIWSGRQIEKWDPRYKLLNQWTFFDRHPARWRWVWWLTRVPPLRQLAWGLLKLVHVRFGEPPKP